MKRRINSKTSPLNKKKLGQINFHKLPLSQLKSLKKNLELKPETVRDIIQGKYTFITFKELISKLGIKQTIQIKLFLITKKQVN